MIMTLPPEYPFEKTVADLFDLGGHTFLAYADRFSGWLEVERLPSSSFRNLQKVLLRYFSGYGVPTEISDDGGPPFNGQEYKSFLRRWDVKNRLSSVAYPQSNGRAEAAVKSAKRILLGNINSVTGALDTEAAAKAIMTHRNTPAQGTGVSPAELLFGRNLRDHLPRVDRKLRQEWQEISHMRAQALAKRAVTEIEKKGQELPELKSGDSVQVQNQYGNHPKKWTNTGIIAEVLPNRQYQVIVDGSRRVTLRNRKFLRRIVPIARKNDLDPGPSQLTNETTPDPLLRVTPNTSVHSPDTSMYSNQLPNEDRIEHPNTGQTIAEQPTTKYQQVIEQTPNPEEQCKAQPLPRRSVRVRTETKFFSPKMSGKTHV